MHVHNPPSCRTSRCPRTPLVRKHRAGSSCQAAGRLAKNETSFSVHVSPSVVPQRRINVDSSPLLLTTGARVRVRVRVRIIPALSSAPTTTAADSFARRAHNHHLAARKPDGTLRREVKGKKRPFVCPIWGPDRARALPRRPRSSLTSSTRPYHLRADSVLSGRSTVSGSLFPFPPPSPESRAIIPARSFVLRVLSPPPYASPVNSCASRLEYVSLEIFF